MEGHIKSQRSQRMPRHMVCKGRSFLQNFQLYEALSLSQRASWNGLHGWNFAITKSKVKDGVSFTLETTSKFKDAVSTLEQWRQIISLSGIPVNKLWCFPEEQYFPDSTVSNVKFSAEIIMVGSLHTRVGLISFSEMF